MRVSILTQPLGHNYGGLLQAYALQFFLQKMGCNVETLDRRAPNKWVSGAKTYLKNFAFLALGRATNLPSKRKQYFLFEHLTQFRDRYIKLSTRIATEKQLREYYRKNHFDVVLVGSDQVWRPRYSPSLFNFYLDFLDDIDTTATRLSYAASFGVSEWEYTPEETRRCQTLIKKFDAVSVREISGVAMCKEHFGIEAVLMPDPTLLLDVEIYRKLLLNHNLTLTAGKVVSYFLDRSLDKDRIQDKIAQWLGLESYSILPRDIEKVGNAMGGGCQYPPVEQWLSALMNASFVVTDSFHGCVFAIIFNKPFIAIKNEKRGEARFYSLLSDFGISERLVSFEKDVSKELVFMPIDWKRVDRIKAAKTEIAKRFLYRNILEEVC